MSNSPAKTFKINPHEYVAVNRPVALSRLVKIHGIARKPNDYTDLALMSKEVADKKGEAYQNDFVEIHPDYLIFESYFLKKLQPEIEKAKTETKEKYCSADGEGREKKPINIDLKNSRTLDMVIGFGLATASIALIVSLVTAMKK